MALVEVWLLGGPADGRLMPVDLPAGDRLPEFLDLPQTGFYFGSSDVPAPPATHRYALADANSQPVVYRYTGSRPLAADQPAATEGQVGRRTLQTASRGLRRRGSRRSSVARPEPATSRPPTDGVLGLLVRASLTPAGDR